MIFGADRMKPAPTLPAKPYKYLLISILIAAIPLLFVVVILPDFFKKTVTPCADSLFANRTVPLIEPEGFCENNNTGGSTMHKVNR